MKNEVFWKNPGYKKRASLKKDIECDYLIVGGGILGVSLAYFLSKEGVKNIVIIEKEHVASGATGKSAGMIVVSGELDLRDVINNHGRNKAKIFWKTSHEGIAIMKDIIKKEKINCDFEIQDKLYGGLQDESHKWILEEYAVEEEIEADTRLLSEVISEEQMHRYIKTDLFKYAIYTPNHGISINPLAYTQNLSKSLDKKGVSIYEDTPLVRVKDNLAFTKNGKIKFKNCVVAIDADLKNKSVKSRRATIVVTDKLSKKQIDDIGLTKKKFVWTSRKSYEYLKLTKDNRMLIGTGDLSISKKEKGIKIDRQNFNRILRFLPGIFPQLKTKFDYAWSATYGVTRNYIPVIDVKDNIISVGGASSQLVCTITAKYLADKYLNRFSALDKFFWV